MKEIGKRAFLSVVFLLVFGICIDQSFALTLKNIQSEVSGKKFKVVIVADSPIRKYRHFFLTNGPFLRLVVDLSGNWKVGLSKKPNSEGAFVFEAESNTVEKIRVGKHSDRLRVVLDLKIKDREFISPHLGETSEGLTLTVSEAVKEDEGDVYGEPAVFSAKSEDRIVLQSQYIDHIIIKSSSFLFNAITKKDYPLSESCKKLIKDTYLGPSPLHLEGSTFKFHIKPSDDIVIITVTEDWFPLALRNTNNKEILSVHFRNGEFGLQRGQIYIKEGTEAKLRRMVYKFHSGKWVLL
ncbi:MAG: AMIN domain-containing protein [Deltaproteobacteria bacterium]|nr:AMIN domain-containing protein [Deltaproteobacteria bacterium]